MNDRYYISKDNTVLYIDSKTGPGYWVYYKQQDLLNNSYWEKTYFVDRIDKPTELNGPFTLPIQGK